VEEFYRLPQTCRHQFKCKTVTSISFLRHVSYNMPAWHGFVHYVINIFNTTIISIGWLVLHVKIYRNGENEISYSPHFPNARFPECICLSPQVLQRVWMMWFIRFFRYVCFYFKLYSVWYTFFGNFNTCCLVLLAHFPYIAGLWHL
jgi:hypothetical protein